MFTNLPPTHNGATMLAEIPLEQYAAVLDRCAEDALWEANVDRPPVDAFAVARRLRLQITSDSGQSERARFVRPQVSRANRLSGLIVLGPEERPERRQWAVAHEVGEAIAYRVFETLGTPPGDAPPLERERVANSLAGRLLAPRRWLTGVAQEVDLDLFATKEIFATASHELIARRLLECWRTPIVVTVLDNSETTWRRWNVAGKAPPVLESERACQDQSHRTASPVVCWPREEEDLLPVVRIRSWPIHEPDWLREIVLTEIDEL